MWIDAICINQDQRKEATKEREAQVKTMGRIYAKAKTVFIHLSASAVRYDTKFMERLISWLHSQNDDLFDNERTRHMMYTLSGEEYFKRTWTIQEVILAKEVFILFRDFLLPWPLLLSRFLDIQLDLDDTMGDILARAPFVRVQRLLRNDRSPGLLDVLRATATSKATDLRDKIYALLGLIEGDTEHYPVKYGTWTAPMVFAYYTFRFCEERNSLDVLEKSRHIARTSIKELPSWANNFTHSEEERRYAARKKGYYSNSHTWCKTRFRAHDHLPLSIKLELDQNLAPDSQGRKVGEIRFISPCNLDSDLAVETRFSGRLKTKLYNFEILSEHLDRLTDPQDLLSSGAAYRTSWLPSSVPKLVIQAIQKVRLRN